MNRPAEKTRRRDPAFRRLLLGGLVPLLLAPAAAAAPAAASAGFPLVRGQGPAAPRLTAREVRVTRSETGDYRVLEIIDLAPGATTEDPLPLVELPDIATRFAGAGAGIEPTDILFNESTVSILRWPEEVDTIQVLISYELPNGAEKIRFLSPLATGEFGVSVARGSVHARIDPGLEPAGEVGSAASPRRRFVTATLEPGTPISIELGSNAVGWRERLAVLMAAALAVALGAVWVWRS